MIDAREAIAWMSGIAFAGAWLIDRRRIEAWIHDRTCSLHRDRRRRMHAAVRRVYS